MYYSDFEAQVARIVEEEGVPATNSDWVWTCWKAFGRLNVQLAGCDKYPKTEETPLVVKSFKPEGPGC